MSLTSFLLFISVLGLVSCAGVIGSPEAANIRIQGAGASFPFPIYSKWFKVYSTAHQNVQIDYQSVGSGAGVKNFIDKTVDFGASDMAPSSVFQAARLLSGTMSSVFGGVVI